MLGPPKSWNLDRPVLISLEAYVPKDHFYRQLERTLDLAFVRNLATDCYASGGRPSIDPVVFFKLHLVMFFAGIRSERKLLEQASYNLAMRWYVGYNLDEPLPDHSSLSKIRARLGLPVFRRFFDVVTEQCVHAGLVWGKELIFDATKVRANAAMESLIPVLRLVVDDHLAVLTEADVPEEAACWELLEECRLDPHRPPTSYYERKSDQRVSTTDPDAALMRPRGERRGRARWGCQWRGERGQYQRSSVGRSRRAAAPSTRGGRVSRSGGRRSSAGERRITPSWTRNAKKRRSGSPPHCVGVVLAACSKAAHWPRKPVRWRRCTSSPSGYGSAPRGTG